MPDSPAKITNPADGDTVKGSRVDASVTAPSGLAIAQGTLKRVKNPPRSCDGVVNPVINTTTRWVISFSKDLVNSLFTPADHDVLQVVLTVTDGNGDTTHVTFTIDRTPAIARGKKTSRGNKGAGYGGGAITPDPSLKGKEFSGPFTSGGYETPAGVPLYAFIMQPGGMPIIGVSVQAPSGQNGGEFVFSWPSVPSGTNYYIYYQSYGPDGSTASDGPFTVD